MITGQTKVFGIIADPIGHVRTPQAMNAYFAQHAADAVLVPFHVAPQDLEVAWTGFRRIKSLGGLIVTVPHKSAVVSLCDEVGQAAAQIGAANAVRRKPDGRMACEMFDGMGFVTGLVKQGIDTANLRVLLIGAGGAASAIAFALAARGCAALTIANRTLGKAADLADRVKSAYGKCDVRAGAADPTGHDLIVNATSLGLRPEDPLPLKVEKLTPEMCVAEVVMNPEETALLAHAAEAGCRTHLGRHMLEAQVQLLADFIDAVPLPNTAAGTSRQ